MLMIYGKQADDKRYKPMNLAKGVQVTNLIHATLWPPSRREKLDKYIAELNEDNPDWDFEIRRKK